MAPAGVGLSADDATGSLSVTYCAHGEAQEIAWDFGVPGGDERHPTDNENHCPSCVAATRIDSPSPPQLGVYVATLKPYAPSLSPDDDLSRDRYLVRPPMPSRAPPASFI